MFYIKLGIDKAPPNIKTCKRLAVRAVIHCQDKILLVQSAQGEMKFPGGGVESGEEMVDALLREIREETGYIHVKVGNLVGKTLERKKDMFNENDLFEMKSVYYSCKLINEDSVEQKLDKYERDLAFRPVFVTIEDAVENNEMLLPNLIGETKRWTERDTLVLKELLQ